MESLKSCSRCRAALSTPSGSGLCPACQVLFDTPDGLAPTLRNQPARANDPTVRHADIKTGDHLPAAPPGFDVLRRLGGGGMGDVYLARERATDRQVAMKFLWSPSDRSAYDRFLVEVRALATVDHPNIVRVLSADVTRSDPYFTMEYCAGGTLGRWVEERGPLPPKEAAGLIRTLAHAAHAAHAAGVVHRDIKPSNVLLAVVSCQSSVVSKPELPGSELTTENRQLTTFSAKLSDFGLAKRLDKDDDLTATGGALGTPGYMPPEQVSKAHGEIGPAADVYGLGATLFHALTGLAPFRGGTPPEIAAQVVRDPAPRVRKFRPGVPIELEAVVAKCLEKNPAERYASAAELAADLGLFLDGRVPRAPLLSWRRRAYRSAVRHRGRVALAFGSVLVLVGVFAFGAFAARPAPPGDPFEPAQKDLAVGKAVTLVGETGVPKYYRFVNEPATLAPSEASEKAASFQSFGHSLLELVPDPGSDSYRVSMELKQLASVDQRSPHPNDRVGLYFGYADGTTADRARVSLACTFTFNELDRVALAGGGPNPPPYAKAGTLGLLRDEHGRGYNFTASWEKVVFAPAAQPPGPWRKIIADVTALGVTIYWREDAGHLTAAAAWTPTRATSHYEKSKRLMDERFPGVVDALPQWHPRRPFGVVAVKAAVAVRNVTLEPLP